MSIEVSNSFLKNNPCTLIYHGSSESIENPSLDYSRDKLDFGRGFYCINLFMEAVRWARLFPKYKKEGIVNTYIYLPDNSLKIKVFDKMNDEWLDFVVDSRQGKPNEFDIVQGPMVDSHLFNYLEDYEDGIIPREVFWMMAKDCEPIYQIAFLSNDALKCLEFIGSEVVVDGKHV